jgi:methylated-DNA-[protein]-cysteine S-methyltransferase
MSPFTIDRRWKRDDGFLAHVRSQLNEYFRGERSEFDVRLKLDGNRFELAVWSALCEIPYGATTSYGRIARALGHPHAPRAVGVANARNPMAIIVPCHRVIGADGSLTGYGGGLGRKRFLLDLESGVMPLGVAAAADTAAATGTAPATGITATGSAPTTATAAATGRAI